MTLGENHPVPDLKVACIILNWNGWQDTIECLDAVKSVAYPNLQIIVVDNGSTNDSVNKMRVAHSDVLLLETGANLGFAGGNNVGIRKALEQNAEYIWLLNNDTKPEKNALAALVAKVSTDQRIGAVASVTYFASAPEVVEAWGGARVNLWIGYGHNSTTPRADTWFHSLNGTSLLVSSRAIEDVGLLDEGFFLYWEDTEFCLRLRKKGWRIAAAEDSRVLHKVNASTGGNKLILDRYQTASGLRLLKLYSPSHWIASFLFLNIRFLRRMMRLEFARCKSVWRGIQDYRGMYPISQRIR